MTSGTAIAVVALAILTQNQASAEQQPQKSEDLYAQARALYKEGPSKAPEIIDLLKRHLVATPEHDQAVYLLGVTYFGVADFTNALKQFDQGIALAETRKQIAPELVFYRARTLYELGRCLEARQILDSHWALWQDDGRLKDRYDKLRPVVEAGCGEKQE